MKRWLGEVGLKMQQRREDREEVIVIDGDTLRSWLAAAMAETGKPAAADDIHRFLDIIKRRSGLMIERATTNSPSPTSPSRSTSPPSTRPTGSRRPNG